MCCEHYREYKAWWQALFSFACSDLQTLHLWLSTAELLKCSDSWMNEGLLWGTANDNDLQAKLPRLITWFCQTKARHGRMGKKTLFIWNFIYRHLQNIQNIKSFLSLNLSFYMLKQPKSPYFWHIAVNVCG